MAQALRRRFLILMYNRCFARRRLSFRAQTGSHRALPSRGPALGLVGLTALLYVGCARLAPEAARGSVADPVPSESVRVERRNFRRTLRLHGTVMAVQSYAVTAPRLAGQALPTMTITRLVPNGARVQLGDVLVEFDRQTQIRAALDRESEYQNLLELIKRKQADQAAAQARDETELKSAEYDLQAARVDMRKNEVVSSIDAEKNRQNLAEAEARLKQIQNTAPLKREAAAAELRILEIQRDRAQKAMAYAQANIEKMTIRSPLAGLVVLTSTFKMSRIGVFQEGDEARPGSPILLVVNPSAMQVRVRINQVDIYSIRANQTAEVRLDAYPDLSFPGLVERISMIASTSDYSKQVRFFSGVIAIQGSDPKLLPDLSAAVDVQVESLDDVLVVPREAVLSQDGRSMVEVVREGRSELRPVKTGPMNDLDVVIVAGLEEGTFVARNPHPTEPAKAAPSGAKQE